MQKLNDDNNCLKCRYAMEQQIDNISIEKQWVCVFNPPTVQVIPLPNGLMNVTAFPTVKDTMLCNQYNQKPMIVE